MRAKRTKTIEVPKVEGVCVICKSYGIGGIFDGEHHVCALCIKGIIGRHPDDVDM